MRLLKAVVVGGVLVSPIPRGCRRLLWGGVALMSDLVPQTFSDLGPIIILSHLCEIISYIEDDRR